MNFENAFYALLCFTLVRELFFMWQTHRLLNKAMSRSYFEHQQAQQMGKVKISRAPPEDNDMEEDLGALQGIV